MRYRADIDGLRAVAVGAVVLGHAGTPGFSGGFLGVDIFFVISGYLITQILMSEQGINLAAFYERRIRRIVPALAVVLLLSSLAAVIIISPWELVLYGKSQLAASAFSANLYFSLGVTYWAPRFPIPLLHLWSLGVEEQFYVFYPLFLWLMLRYAKAWLRPALVVVLVLSVGGSEFLIHYNPRQAFYFTGSRTFELMFGALAALYPLRRDMPNMAAQALSVVATAAVGVPLFTFTSTTPLPGLLALVPVGGTAALIVLHARHKTIVSSTLSLRPVVFIGLISYSLYLWHWPLFEFFSRWVLRVPTPLEYLSLISTAITLATASWWFIEKPFRNPLRVPKRAVFAIAAGFGIALVAISITFVWTHGLPGRYSTQIQRMYRLMEAYAERPESNANRSRCDSGQVGMKFSFEKCIHPVKGKTNVLIWGDSHAMHYVPGIQAAADTTYHIMRATFPSCRPLLVSAGSNACNRFNHDVLRNLAGVDVVILSMRLYNQKTLVNEIPAIVRHLRSLNLKVIVIGPSLEYQMSEPLYVARFLATGDHKFLDSRYYLRADRAALDQLYRDALKGTGALYISPFDVLCPGGACPMTYHGVPTNHDPGHLTIEGSMLFGRAIWARIQPMLR